MKRRIVATSDFCAPLPVSPPEHDQAYYKRYWEEAAALGNGRQRYNGLVEVRGGYLERLPLAAVRAGLCDIAETWSFSGHDAPGAYDSASPAPSLRGMPETLPIRRRFRADSAAPFRSADARAHVEVFGAPGILCVWGLGVDEALLACCTASVRVYNSIDAPALRIPEAVGRHVDLFLTSAAWQDEEIRRRYPGSIIEVLPIGPEFASPDMFYPTGVEKDFDVIYVAAAQDYKRHDILFDAFESLPTDLRGVCLFGYGENAGRYRAEIDRRGLNIECIGPPGVGYPEVNAWMNRARIGVVCGEEDGAPAILTEYMLAGLPVLANEALHCGRQYITPATGLTVPAARFYSGILALLERAPGMRPRDVVLEHWTWEKSIARFSAAIERARQRKSRRGGDRP